MNTLTLPDKSYQGIYEIAPGLAFQWLFGGKGVAYTLSGSRRETVDFYIEATRAVSRLWPSHQPYLSLHDITDYRLTPHLRARAREAAMAGENLNNSMAIVIQKSVMGHAMRFFFNTELLRRVSDRTVRIFHRRSQAVNWLHSQLGTLERC